MRTDMRKRARFCGRARLVAFAVEEKTDPLQNRIDGASGEYVLRLVCGCVYFSGKKNRRASVLDFSRSRCTRWIRRVAGHGPDCLFIANGAQAAHVTGTPNVYRMDRSVFQVLQERSPACQDCRCGKRPCAGHTASSSCVTFARNARVWRQNPKNDLRHDLV
ncbi:uncharacterized protein [Mycetomoellerius zeteki]|uniref:uncharacterized protein n=1 Tax=Mycetomoellerius zeteki TaxID=64791 RepID=UPI00084E5049|nr:PREDICTED: uncharacterized protein LOC108725136 [Trachymyrmex zeteki]